MGGQVAASLLPNEHIAHTTDGQQACSNGAGIAAIFSNEDIQFWLNIKYTMIFSKREYLWKENDKTSYNLVLDAERLT